MLTRTSKTRTALKSIKILELTELLPVLNHSEIGWNEHLQTDDQSHTILSYLLQFPTITTNAEWTLGKYVTYLIDEGMCMLFFQPNQDDCKRL